MINYLGIDYGLSHIGLSLSQHMLATPLPTLPNNHDLLQNLQKIITDNQISQIVCGIPEGKLVPIIKQFAKDLETTSGVPVALHPETLSSQEAIQKLRESGASKAKRKNDHAYAACLILEDYLEFKSTVY